MQSGRIWLRRVPDGEDVATLDKHEGAVDALAFQPGGLLLASGSRDGTVRLWRPVRNIWSAVLKLRGAGEAKSAALRSVPMVPSWRYLSGMRRPSEPGTSLPCVADWRRWAWIGTKMRGPCHEDARKKPGRFIFKWKNEPLRGSSVRAMPCRLPAATREAARARGDFPPAIGETAQTVKPGGDLVGPTGVAV